jgi:hypothetical protein
MGASEALSVPQLVGRASELEQLRTWTDEARNGEPRLILLRGEAGMGKSRLMSELCASVGPATLVLSGSCHEDVAVPYLPIAHAMRPLLPEWPTGRVKDFEREEGDARLALFLHVSQVLTNTAAVRPVVLAIDDAHWADRASVELLAHLVATAAIDSGRRPLQLTILVAHRPVIVDATLARELERFAREPMARQLELLGLDRLGLNVLITAITGTRPSRRLVQDLHTSSGGNPLLAISLLERLDAFGALQVRNGWLTAKTAAEPLGLPAGLDSVLRDRIELVTASCQRLLQLASFLGDRIDDKQLAVVSGLDLVAVDEKLDEAIAVGLVVADDDGDRFSHPQVRQLLYHGPRGRRRAALHLQIADRLEQASGEDPAVVPLIAHHLQRAGADVDPDRLAQRSLEAAALAARVGAWADTWRHYEAALSATSDSATFPSAFRALLHHRAAVAAWNDHDNARAVTHADRAVEHARALGDLERWGPAAVLAARIRVTSGVGALGAHIDREPLEAFLADADDREPSLRALAYAQLAELDNHENHPVAGLDAARQAWKLAEDDPATQRAIVASVAIVHLGMLDLREAERWYAIGAQPGPPDADPLPQVWSTVRLGLTRWATGRLDEAEHDLHAAVDLARRAQKVANEALATACLAGIATARGSYDEAERLGARCARLFAWSDYGFAPAMLYPTLASGRITRGDAAGAYAALDELEQAGGRGVWRYRYLVDVRRGATDEVRAAIAARPIPPPAPRRLGLYDIGNAAALVELGVFLGDTELVAPLVAPLEAAAEGGLVVNPGWPFVIADLLVAARALVAE